MAFNLLIVDDSSIIRSMIERTVRMSGVPLASLFTAGNGAEALEVLRGNWVDLVFADLNMPVMDGVSMIETMNADTTLCNVPVVVVSTVVVVSAVVVVGPVVVVVSGGSTGSAASPTMAKTSATASSTVSVTWVSVS